MDNKKVAVILGGTGGIGSFVCSYLKQKGYIVISLGRSYEKDFSTNDGIDNIKCDASSEDEVKNAIEKVIEIYGHIDVFINASGMILTKSIEEITMEDLIKSSINFAGALYAVKYVLPFMKRDKNGYIINIGSVRSDEYGKDKSVYSITKSVLKAFFGSLREECKDYNIKVSIISPGVVNTNLWKKENWKSIEYITQPEDVAKTILFLLELSNGAEIDEIVIGKLFDKYNKNTEL